MLLCLAYLNVYLMIAEGLSMTFIPPTRSSPSARTFSLILKMNIRDSIILFGGWSESFENNDLWEFSLSSLTWAEIKPLSNKVPLPRSSPGGFTRSSSEIIYVFGGKTNIGLSNDLWKFDFELMEWEELVHYPPPRARSMFGFGSYSRFSNDYFFVFAGSSYNGELNDLHILDINTLLWEKINNEGEAPQPVLDPVISYYDGFLYVAAGKPKNSEICLPYLYRYSIDETKWEVISDKNSTFKCRNLAKGFIYNDVMFIYSGWDYILSEDINESLTISLNSDLKVWKSELLFKEALSDTYSLVQDDSSVYIFGGFDTKMTHITNRLCKLNLKTQKVDILSSYSITPSARSMHSMISINTDLYIFGGINSISILNDIWSFNLLDSKWTQVSAQGAVPTPRYLHAFAASGNIFVVWGGIGDDGLKNDAFIFNVISGNWRELPSSDKKPKPAQGACMAFDKGKFYLFGGSTSSGFSNELWEYDLSIGGYTQLESADEGVLYSYCWIENAKFFVSLGACTSYVPYPKIKYYDIEHKKWGNFHQHKLSNNDSIQSIQVHLKDFLLSIGGQQWGQSAFKSIRILSNTSFNVLDSQIDFYIYGAGSVYFNRSIYIFGGGGTRGNYIFPKNSHNLFTVINAEEICRKGGCKAYCSIGLIEVNGSCQLCAKGTYSEELGSKYCTSCKPGTYNDNLGSTNNDQCLPCPEGEYNDEFGASKCKPCGLDNFCPIGTINPKKQENQQDFQSIQPSLYNQPGLARPIIIYQTLVSIPLFIILLIFVSVPKLRKKLEILDLFEDKHDNTESNTMIKKKTKIGACFSFIFIICSLLLTCTTILTFFKANIQETKGLVPLVVLESEVSAFNSNDLSLQIMFFSFGSDCEINSKCSSSILISDKYIKSSEKTSACSNNEGTCKIQVKYKNAEILTGAEIIINVLGSSSYSSGIDVNLTSSSSIPNQISSVYSAIKPDNGSVFIGSTFSEFYFLGTPSLFKSDSTKWKTEDTGYHISERTSPKLGSFYDAKNMPGVFGLNVRVSIEKSSTGLLTQRLTKQDFWFFVGALIGSVSGLFGIFGFVMAIVESKVEVLLKKSKNKISPQTVKKTLNECNTTKVIDIKYEIENY